MADPTAPENGQGPDPQRLQALYARINELGGFKEPGSRLQQLGHRLRELGAIQDPTQGGLAPSPSGAPITRPGSVR